MLLLFQCRKCGKFFCRSKHYTASVSNICCVKIITPCNINRQRILMIPCFIFYRNPEYAGKHISHSPFNSFSFILTLTMLKVKFLSYFDFSKILFSHTMYFSPGVWQLNSGKSTCRSHKTCFFYVKFYVFISVILCYRVI